MKLKTLHIHNLASIEDATLDFSSEPLRGSEVFLITGKTGSGKTTILDAICLALFAKTPRLENTRMSGETMDLEQEVKVKDVRQLMRRNTGEAWSRLVFEGNNGIDYEAEWYVARARKKVDGKLQLDKRFLKRVSDGVSFDKVRDIEPEIQRAVGLDFSQFCRTTMLAQGQFTQFLNSDDKDKAAILEKITGVDVYTRIGKKLHELASSKQREWQQAQLRIDGTPVLSEEEAVSKKSQADSLRRLGEELASARKSLQAKRDYLSKREELSMLSVEQSEALDAARTLWESEGMREKKALVDSWKETLEPRMWLKERERLRTEVGRTADRLAEKSGTFASCRASLLKETGHLDSERARLLELDAGIDGMKAKSRALEKAQSIVAQLGVVVQGRKSILEFSQRRAALQAGIEGQMGAEHSAAVLDEKKVAEQVAGLKAALEVQEHELESFRLDKLRGRKEDMDSRLSAVSIARERLRSLEQTRKRLDDEAASVKDLEAGNARRKEMLSALEQPLAEAKLRVQERSRSHELQLTTVDKWARKARKSLGKGDICPVCGQKVQDELPREDLLDELLEQALNELERARQELVDLDCEYADLDNRIKVSDQLLEARRRALREDSSLAAASKSAAISLSALGIVSLDDASKALDAMQSAAQVEKEAVMESIGRAESIEKEARRLSKELETARGELEKAKDKTASSLQKLDEARAACQSLSDLVSEKEAEVERSQSLVNDFLEESGDWRSDWRSAPEEFIEEIDALALSYKELNEDKVALEERVKERMGLIGRVQLTLSEILSLCPGWNDLPPGEASAGNLEESVKRLHSEVIALVSSQVTGREKISSLDDRIGAFVSAHSSYTLESLGALDSFSSSDIDAVAAEVAEASSALEKAGALLEATRKQIARTEEAKPELEEGDSFDSLSDRLTSLDLRLGEVHQSLGALVQEIESDERTKVRLRSLVEDAELKRKEHLRWSRLDSLIGNPTGEVFRKVAQSYVLSALVHSANSYMRTLAPRYSLQVQPGSFVISIEDAFQGYARRAASTISGGESFLVSLSLALALSDIGTQLSVDTLFIDEGFGTLSGEPLRNAVDTLRSLHSRLGRHVGIISHVEELKERLPVQIQVEQEGGSSSSKVTVTG